MTEPRLRALPELLVLLARPDEYLVTNPFTRTYVLADAPAVELLSYLRAERSQDELRERFTGRSFVAVGAGRSRFADGLLGDPTGLDRELTLTGVASSDLDTVLDLLRTHQLVVEDELRYTSSLGARRNLLDRERRGTIHQQVADHVLLEVRERDLDRWWLDQKFVPDRSEPRPGLYRDVQLTFMEAQFRAPELEGRRVLDFGCGPGLFSRFFASRGARVLGVDVNEQHLETARALARQEQLEEIEFRTLEHPVDQWLDALDTEPFDLVFLSDVLMFYYHPYSQERLPTPSELLAALRRRLKESGTIAVLEPDGDFWQRPWFGSPERPFTVATEHATARERVTPTLEELSLAAEAADLAIARVRELTANSGSETPALAFAHEFPLWRYVELRPSQR